jgi:hypothetical protein
LSDTLGISSINPLVDVYQFARRTTWLSNDVFFMQSVFAKEARGMSRAQAIAETAKHIPDYRIPSRVLGQKWVADVMRNNLVTMFSAYHYGMLKSYGQMFKEAFGGAWQATKGVKEGAQGKGWQGVTEGMQRSAKGLDHIAALGLITFGAYKAVDEILKKITGDPNARMRRAGAATIPDALSRVWQGKMEPGDLATAVITPAAGSERLYELLRDRDFRSGEKIFDPHDTMADISMDIGGFLAGSLGPVQQYQRFHQEQNPMGKFLWSLAGVTFPKSESRTPAEIAMHRILGENMPQMTPERRREMEERQKRIAEGHLTLKEQDRVAKQRAMGDLEFYLSQPEFSYSEVKRVMRDANAEERKVILPILQEKAYDLLMSDPDKGEQEGALETLEARR